MSRKKGHFEVALPPDLAPRIELMMKRLDVLDPSEVVTRAVRLFDRALAVQDEGDRIVIRYRSGGEDPLV